MRLAQPIVLLLWAVSSVRGVEANPYTDEHGRVLGWSRKGDAPSPAPLSGGLTRDVEAGQHHHSGPSRSFQATVDEDKTTGVDGWLRWLLPQGLQFPFSSQPADDSNVSIICRFPATDCVLLTIG
jgi:hypothetical protein